MKPLQLPRTELQPLRVRRRTVDAAAEQQLRAEGLSALLARLYAARGVRSRAQAEPTLRELAPAATLLNCERAAQLLADAVERAQHIRVVSDYDADGATGCAVLVSALRAWDARVDFCVPDRLKHGYGLTPAIADIACHMQPVPDWLVTVDNGISSAAGVARARALGVKVLVTDHHLPGAQLPDADCTVNPNQPGCSFPSKALAGCGVAFYVAWAFDAEMRRRGWSTAFDVLDLLPYVATGTVADVVPLDVNNRALVSEGLKRMRAGRCPPGLQALAKVARRPLERLTTTDIGFGIGPRINAAGRLESMDTGILCLLASEDAQALELAQALDDINARRKDAQDVIVEQAAAQALARITGERAALVVYDNTWHEGIVGIVAGRIKDALHRPTFVLTNGADGAVKGSGRSIPGFHLKHALDTLDRLHPGMLAKYGGHAMAAGVTLAASADAFAAAFDAVVRDLMEPQLLERTVAVDTDLGFAQFDAESVAALELAVWGQSFEPPLFEGNFVVREARRVGSDGRHTKLVLDDGARVIAGVAFSTDAACFGERTHVLYRPALNIWNDRVRVEARIEHVLD